MRILLLGKHGQLGWELHRTLQPLGEVIALDYPEIDLTSPDSIRDTVQKSHPEVIINAAAYTDVDRAESEPEIAMAVNGIAPGLLAEQATSYGAGLIHYSTDYVFDGMKSTSYTELDKPNPINVYGRSKLAGEQSITKVGDVYLIFRTSWVYSLRRACFVTKVLERSRSQETMRMVSDQTGSPTWARMLAEITAQLIAKGSQDIIPWIKNHQGIYHLAGNGAVNRLDLAKAILEYDQNSEEQIIKEILPALTNDFSTPAKRPLFTALNSGKFLNAFGIGMPNWRLNLQMAMSFE